WPSSTRIARTTPVSNGWTILTLPLGTILPVAAATMSMVPHAAHASAAQKSRITVTAMPRRSGDGGVSTISSAAGRNASSSRRRSRGRGGTTRDEDAAAVASADLMEASLQSVQRRVAAAGLDQRVVGAVLDQPAAIEGDDAVGAAHGRQPVCDDQDGAAL